MPLHVCLTVRAIGLRLSARSLRGIRPRLSSNCVEPQTHVSGRSPIPGWIGEPFLLCVAQHRQNKNLLLLLRVFRTLLLTNRLSAGARLVIIGVPGPQTKPMQRFLALTQLQDRVSLLNGLSDEEVQWCYRNCNLLVAPSVVEGFGLPVAEALLLGAMLSVLTFPPSVK